MFGCAVSVAGWPVAPRTVPGVRSRGTARRPVAAPGSAQRLPGAAHPPAPGQLVVGVVLPLRRVGDGTLAGQRGERALHLAPDPAEGDAEHALAALQQVDDLVRRGALVDAGPVAHQR